MPLKARLQRFFFKLRNWEFWPFSIVYFPVFFYYFYLIAKTRSFFFFTASNPSIDFGGMFGEKKSDIFKLIPDQYLPKTVLITKGEYEKAKGTAQQIGYPLICKPDIGERGIWVKVIKTEAELNNYLDRCPVDFLIQELVTYEVELGVFFVKYPGKKGQVTSIVQKGFFTVEGNGTDTVSKLLAEDMRSQLQVKTEKLDPKLLHYIPALGEKVLVEPIGNHNRGTTFLNANNQIDDALNNVFNEVSDQIHEFYFGRYDLRCASFESLKRGEGFKILELNGAGAEPGHIYHPGFSLLQAYRDILWHLGVLADISALNRNRGFSYWNFKEGYFKWKEHTRYIKMLKRT